MAKMCFPTAVKYNSKNYAAREVFNVKESDVEELRKKGGWLIQEKTVKTTPLTNTIIKQVDKK